MRFFAGIVLLVLMFSVYGFECNLEGNQAELNQCALDDYEAADKKLNHTWKALLQKSGDDGGYVKKLRVAQRAWIAFRDAEVAAMFACEEEDMRVCWGSMYPLFYHGAMTELTEQRTSQLQRYLDRGRNLAVSE